MPWVFIQEIENEENIWGAIQAAWRDVARVG